jgi:hypothetical protein
MTPTYSFEVNPVLSLVTCHMAGFYEPADVVKFAAARDLAHQQLRCGPNQHLTLIDIREMQIQSQESVAAFEKVLHSPAYYSRRIAIVVTKSLAKMQVQRAAQDRPVQYFADDVTAARLWLLEQPSHS